MIHLCIAKTNRLQSMQF